jgi:hypothetical protein
MKDKLRTPFQNPHPVPGLTSSPGCYSKVPVDGLDQPVVELRPLRASTGLIPCLPLLRATS